MVSIGGLSYEIVTREDTKYFIRNDMVANVDTENDTDTVLTLMSDFVMEFKKCRDCSAIGEWFTKRGGNNVV
jgi:hypothetical protein